MESAGFVPADFFCKFIKKNQQILLTRLEAVLRYVHDKNIRKEVELMKSKRELRDIAKERLVGALAKAYYSVCDDPEFYGLTDDEADVVVKYMNSYGETMCKAIRKEYYTV